MFILINIPAISKKNNDLCLQTKPNGFLVEKKYKIMIKAKLMDIMALAKKNILNNIAAAAKKAI